MIRVCGLEFYEKEDIQEDMILTCHPQMVGDSERIGVPLRATEGYQCIYSKKTMKFGSIAFYAPPKEESGGATYDNLKYVLACLNGNLSVLNGDLVLKDPCNTIVYSNLNILKSSGSVRKGQILGTVKAIPPEIGYGYGVILKGYKNDSEVWDIQKDIHNIPCVE